MFRKLSVRALVAAIALVATPAVMAGAAHADDRDGRGGRGGHHNSHNNNHNNHNNRGGGDWRRDNDRGRSHDWDRGRDNHRDDRRYYDNHRHRGPDLSLSFNLGRPYYGYAAPYYSAPAASYSYNAYGLSPHACIEERRWDYWRGRPAEIMVRLCANAYGDIYIVEGSQRFIQYRY